jgi:hypothetical protein
MALLASLLTFARKLETVHSFLLVEYYTFHDYGVGGWSKSMRNAYMVPIILSCGEKVTIFVFLVACDF